MSNKRIALASVVILALVVVIAIALGGRHREYSERIVQVDVNYDQPVESLLVAGHYDPADPDITSERFPSVHHGQRSVKIHLLCFRWDDWVSSDEVLATMAKHGLRPAEVRELLALGANRSFYENGGPIVVLAPSCPPPWPKSGGRCILTVELSDEGHQAWLDDNVSTGWNGDFIRFAAVAKDK